MTRYRNRATVSWWCVKKWNMTRARAKIKWNETTNQRSYLDLKGRKKEKDRDKMSRKMFTFERKVKTLEKAKEKSQ